MSDNKQLPAGGGLTEEAIEWAWRYGWRACRDAETVGFDSENTEWDFAAANVIARTLRIAALPAVVEPAPVVEAGKWEGAEEWMPLAWELCANECGEEACAELVWEGGPIPEPWGDRWMKYESQAREMIAMVRKHVPPLAEAGITQEKTNG